MNTKADKPAQDEPGFEEAMQRLEEIVDAMEDGELPLDQAMSRFEEGMKLVRRCSEKLNAVEQRIEQLIEQNGQWEAKPLDEVSVQKTGENH